MTHTDLLIIGAGMAGMAAARAAQSAGLSCTVIDKGRGRGGRISTRRSDGGGFDHGAQYATARTPAFRNWLDDLSAAGRAAPWTPTGKTRPEDWWVGVPRMSALVRHPDLDSTDVRLGLKAERLHGEPHNWSVDVQDPGTGRSTSLGPFHRVLLTVPARQVPPLVAGLDVDLGRLDRVTAAPCWTVMARFDAPVPMKADIVQGADPALGWAARNTSKPGRGTAEDWVLQAGPDWSAEHLETPPEQVTQTILAAFEKAAGRPLPSIIHRAAHRWRYARTLTPLGERWIEGEGGSLVITGDWALGARIEAAFEAGHSAGTWLARQISYPRH